MSTREYYASYREKNREEIRRKGREYHAKNRDSRLEYLRVFQKENREYCNEATRQWRQNNRDITRLYKQNRRKLVKGGSLSKNIKSRLMELQQGKCAICKNPLTDYHLDHIMPLALGGGHIDSNIQLLCPQCNMSKHASHPVDYMQRRGFLL